MFREKRIPVFGEGTADEKLLKNNSYGEADHDNHYRVGHFAEATHGEDLYIQVKD